MKQTKTYCDACGAKIKKDYGVDKGELKLVGARSKRYRITWDDLCHACTAKLFDLLNRFRRDQ